MTLQEYDKKIRELKVVRDHATGMRKSDLAEIIDDLETARVQLIAEGFSALDGFPNSDSKELEEIAKVFDAATEDIENANTLIDKVISIGGSIVSLVL